MTMRYQLNSNNSADFSDTWLIIPCYNEGQVIQGVIENARAVFPNIVAVNDGSHDIIVGTRFGRPKSDHDQVPWIKRLVLQTVVLLSRKTRKLGLTDAHNGLRAFNRRVADELNIRMNGMSHASEIVSQIVDNQWRVSEEPVDILYTEYSMSKGQSLINGVNILADGLLVKENLI